MNTICVCYKFELFINRTDVQLRVTTGKGTGGAQNR